MMCNHTSTDFNRDHTIGARLYFSITTEEGEDLSAVPLAIVLDSPDGLTRHVLGYLNDYTDGTLSGDNETVELLKSAEWSAENMTQGIWQMRLFKGTADVDLQLVAAGSLNVIEPAYGAIDL